MRGVSGAIVVLLMASALTLAIGSQPVAAESTIWTVDDDSSADFASIQDAIDAAGPGDIIIVRDGTYTENIEVNKDDLVLKSENGPLATTIQAANPSDNVIRVNADRVDIDGFTARGAVDIDCAGIYGYDMPLSVSHLILSGNYYGIRCYSTRRSSVSVSDSEFLGNTVGISSYSDLGNRYGEIYVYGCNFSGNTYGVYSSYYCGVTAEHSNFSDNTYGMYGHWKLSFITDHCYFSQNDEYAILCDDTWAIGCHNSTFVDNKYAFRGNGMTDVEVDNSVFRANTYGIYSDCMYDDGDPEALRVNGTELSENVCGLYINNGPGVEAEITNSTFSRNTLGIDIDRSSWEFTRIYLNNFEENAYHVDTVGPGPHPPYLFNSPTPREYTYYDKRFVDYLGNYWSEYVGIDEDENGIWDDPYYIDGDADYYPLIKPFENYFMPEDTSSPAAVTDLRALDVTSTGFIYPTGKSEPYVYAGWLRPYHKDYYHLGQDVESEEGDSVYAIADGEIVYVSVLGWGVGNYGILVKHKLKTDEEFLALYGHVMPDLERLRYAESGDVVPSIPVAAGEAFAVIGSYGNVPHLHFGIRPGIDIPPSPWGRMPKDRWPEDNGFVDPIDWITTHTAYAPIDRTSCVVLAWTAPGDDGHVGTATAYDVRYAVSEITEENWRFATQCTNEPVPRPAGEHEVLIVNGLSLETAYNFALETADEVPNWSSLSNVVTSHYLKLEVTPTRTTVNEGEKLFFQGRLTDQYGKGIQGAVYVDDPIRGVCGTISADEDGYFEYSLVPDRAGAFLIAFTVGPVTRTSIVNVGMDVTFSEFPDLKVVNSGGETTVAVLYVDDIEQGRVTVHPGETKEIVKVLRYNPGVTLTVESTTIDMGPVKEAIDATGTITIKGSVGVFTVGGYMTGEGFIGGCIGVGGSLPYLAEGTASICVGEDGISLVGTAGPSMAHAKIKIRLFSFEEAVMTTIGNSPISLVLSDPTGSRVGFAPEFGLINQIEWATYTGPHTEPQEISVPGLKEGNYKVEIVGTDSGSYTLQYLIRTGEDSIYLQEYAGTISEGEVLVSTLLATKTSTGDWETVSTPPTIQAAVDFEPNTLNINSKGKWVTAYIELPVGHGYSVGDIDLGSILLNGQVQAESWPWEIGDYDEDGVPDLMVKFDRSLVCAILDAGEEVTIVISGRLHDGRLFEGKDKIRVISGDSG